MSILRALTGALGAHRETGADGQAAPRDEDDRRTLALPRFLDVSKTLTLTHAEISALYVVVEDCFETEMDGADPDDVLDEARTLARLLRGVIRRWNEAEPEGIYADLLELPWTPYRGPR